MPLLDADLRDPGVTGRTGVPAVPGLSDVLQGRGDLNGVLCLVDGFEGRLSVLPAGSPSALGAELLASEQMAALLACSPSVTIRGHRYVPVARVVAHTSGVVAVARLNQTPRDAVRRMVGIAAAAGRSTGAKSS